MNSKIKILVGILVVGIILILGLLILSNQLPKSGKGEIIEKGESIKFRVDDTLQICTNGLPFSIIKPNGEYVELKHSCAGIVGSGFDQYCENGKIVSKPIDRLCEFSEGWCSGCSDALTCRNESIHETFTWDQKEYVEITKECEGKTIHREVVEQVPVGQYQIIVNGKVIKEFTIK